MAKNKTVIMFQPPYSPDLTPADSFVFPKLKTPKKGKHFATIDEIKEQSKLELLAIRKRSVLRIGKNAGMSVLYLREVPLKGTR